MSAPALLSALAPPVGVFAPPGDEGDAASGLFSSLLDQASAPTEPLSTAAPAAPRLAVTGAPSDRRGLAFGLDEQPPISPPMQTPPAEPMLELAPTADKPTPEAAAAPISDVEVDADPVLPAGLAFTPAQAAPAAAAPAVFAAAMARPAAAPVIPSPNGPHETAADGDTSEASSQPGSADDGAPPPSTGNAPSADRIRNLSAAAPPAQSSQPPAAQSTDAASGETTTASRPADSAQNPTPPASATAKPAPQTAATAEARPAAPAPLASDAPPASAAPAQETSAPAPARDLGLSQVSRVAVETTAQIAAQIIRRLEGRSTRFDMVLTPEHLGRVDVKLDIDSEGRLAARLAFDNPAAATDLRGRADELRRQLQDAGFQLAHDALDFSEREAGSGQAFDQRRERASAFSTRARLGAKDDIAQTPAWTPLSLTLRGVDLKV